jgi:hypothetical protein
MVPSYLADHRCESAIVRMRPCQRPASAGRALSFSGTSVMVASVSRSTLGTDTAFSSAMRTTVTDLTRGRLERPAQGPSSNGYGNDSR